MRTVVAVLALAASGAASAQVIDANGIRAGGVVIDSRGIHTPTAEIIAGGVRTSGADISARGVRTGYGRGGAGLSVLRNGVTATMNCRGGAAAILGNRNRLRLENCSRLDMPGNGNDITVSLVEPAELNVAGNGDTVRFRTPPGVRAQVAIAGAGSQVFQAR